jgi:regulator of protease activity HflC (stomatin/prohibitin superfamily)
VGSALPVVRAGPNQNLVIGRDGVLESRGTAVQIWLRPGTIHVLVPAGKQEAAFEFTQETRDGIPLRFKGIVIYRITDPAAAARLFDFSTGGGVAQITALLTHVCLGELRHVVSHMTMVECIEQRKTTLTEVVQTTLRETIHGDRSPAGAWGVEVEVAQVAQVFIVDAQLRQQLEAEVRNQIKLQSDRSGVLAREQLQLAEMASGARVAEQTLAGDKDALRREQEKVRTQLEIEQERVNAETPVRLLRIKQDEAVLREELAIRQLRNEVRRLEVEGDLLLDRARQDMRIQLLPLEQAPEIAKAASGVLHGTNLSFYGEGGQVLGQLAPVFELLTRSLPQAARAGVRGSAVPGEPSGRDETTT